MRDRKQQQNLHVASIKADRAKREHVCVDHYGNITGPLLSVSGYWAPTGDPA